MTAINISEDKLCDVIAEALSVDRKEISVDTLSSDHYQWDSLGHLSILAALDSSFDNITNTYPELAGASSVKEIISICQGENAAA